MSFEKLSFDGLDSVCHTLDDCKNNIDVLSIEFLTDISVRDLIVMSEWKKKTKFGRIPPFRSSGHQSVGRSVRQRKASAFARQAPHYRVGASWGPTVRYIASTASIARMRLENTDSILRNRSDSVQPSHIIPVISFQSNSGSIKPGTNHLSESSLI